VRPPERLVQARTPPFSVIILKLSIFRSESTGDQHHRKQCWSSSVYPEMNCLEPLLKPPRCSISSWDESTCPKLVRFVLLMLMNIPTLFGRDPVGGISHGNFIHAEITCFPSNNRQITNCREGSSSPVGYLKSRYQNESVLKMFIQIESVDHQATSGLAPPVRSI
jgi:hypothetical protein